MIRILRSFLFIAFLMFGVSLASSQHYTRGAARLGITGGVNLGGEEATLKYANYTAHPYGMTTMEYFLVNRFAIAGSLFAGTLASDISGRTLFPAYGNQPITAYDTKYYGASAGVDWMLPTILALTPIAKFRLGAMMHHTRINGTNGFERRLSKSALLYSLGGGMEYSINRDVKLFFSYDLVLTNSDEIDGLASGDKNDALSVVSLGLTFLLSPGKGIDEVPKRLDALPERRTERTTRAVQPKTPGSVSSESEAGKATSPSAVDENFDPVRGGLAIEQNPLAPATFVTVEQGGVLQLFTSLVLTPIRRFADLDGDPMLFTLTARQTGRESMQLKNYVEILLDNKTIYQGNVELTLPGAERKFSAAEFLDLEELLLRLEGDAPLQRGNYIVRISTVAWDHELSSISQAKFLNMDLRPIFGPESDEARGTIAAKAVDVATEGEDDLVVNFFDAARKAPSASAVNPGGESRDAVRITPYAMTSESQEQFLTEGMQRSFTEALKLRNLAASNPNPSRLKVVIAEVYFPLDEDRLTEEARILLDNAARHLNQHPEIYAELRGFANDVGDETYNATLARRRAQRVIEYLVRQKTSSWRLTASDSDEYLAPVRPGEDSRTGRKVEIVLISR